MNRRLTHFSILLLRWTLGLVVILESVRFVLSSSTAHFLPKARLPAWIQPALGVGEILAAVLFLIPWTALVGSYLLLVIFVLAAVIHILHGQFDVGGLVVYAVVVLVCMAHRDHRTPEAQHE